MEYDITLTGNEKFVLKVDYRPYSYHRIVAILRDYYNAELQLVRGYKEGRYNPYYKQRYNLLDIDTHKVLFENIRLEHLRHFFAGKDIPLNEPKPKRVMPIKRNQGAEAFLQAVKSIQDNRK